MNVVTAGVTRLQQEQWGSLLLGGDIEPAVFAWRRWHDPDPGMAVIVLSHSADWVRTLNTSRVPLLKVDVWQASSAGQADSEALASAVGDRVRAALHLTAGPEFWGDAHVLSSDHVSTALVDDEVEGVPAGWALLTLAFEVHTV